MPPPATASLPAELANAMLRDKWRLRQQWLQIQQEIRSGKDRTTILERWQQRLTDSVQLCADRQAATPKIPVDASLPIAQHADEIRSAIADNHVVVISGATGSGKSTQIPLICLELGLANQGFIGHTQPRRIAARSVAARIAEQTGSPLGDLVGYKIRFADETKPTSLVKVMTDGILLAESQHDRMLNQYSVLIIDEAHERSLNVDFILAYLKQLIAKRNDLKIIITSATIDTEKFASHFGTDDNPVPVIDVPGRTYPVEMVYRPPGIDDEGNAVEEDMEDAAVNAIREILGDHRSGGDILVFLPTEQDIRNVSRKLKSGYAQTPFEVLPLYARLSTEQQNQIFQPHQRQRVVLATNVAESSITVPGIRYVIDTGTARISRYAPRSKVQRLPIEAISQASANQRSGRCGRVASGICVRLFSEEDFDSRPKFTTPEIRRTNLASVILQSMSLDLGKIEEIPFIDPPSAESIREGFKTLFEIGATDHNKKLTPLGRQLSRLPVDPRIGRMLFAADQNHCLADILIIASALELQDPRVRPYEHAKAADTAHQPFLHEDSDFMSLLILWDFLHELKEKLSQNKFRKACAQNFISYSLVRQWQEIYRQLRSLCGDHKLRIRSRSNDYESIHQSLLCGLLSGIATQTDRREYTGAGGIQFRIWPGSSLAKTGADWILVGELVETGNRYGRNVAKIDPAWAESIAGHLVKVTHADPFWSKKKQSAMTNQRVTLFGLPIVARRPVRLTTLDPDESRRLLIEQGLVGDQMRSDPEFLQHNRRVLEEIQSLAAKTRSRQWIVDDQRQFDLYQERLPAEAIDGASLYRLLREDEGLDERLSFTADDLVEHSSDVGDEMFPPEIEIGQMKLPVEYVFAPGEDNDGATITIPQEGLSQIHENHLSWSLPGMLQDRITALIRSLPKSIRRNLVPAPDTAREVAELIEFGQGSFFEQVAEQLSRIAQSTISPEMFRFEKIGRHLQLNLRVIGQEGETIAEGRELQEIRRELPGSAESGEVQTELADWQQDDLVDWTWDRLEEQLVIRRGTADVPVYPAVVDQVDCVSLRLLDQEFRAESSSRQGLATLYQIAFQKQIRSQVNWLPELEKLAIKVTDWFADQKTVSSFDLFKQHLGHLISRIGFVESEDLPGTKDDFEARKSNGMERISVATQDVANWLPKTVEEFHRCQLISEEISSRLPEVANDVAGQIGFLFQTDFLRTVPWNWLQHYPRYLQAIQMRVDRLTSGNQVKDNEATVEIADFEDRLKERLGTPTISLGQIQHTDQMQYVWMIQEFRVSLFAQQLGTSQKVSGTRLEKLWKAIKGMT